MLLLRREAPCCIPAGAASADAMLAARYQRPRHSRSQPEQARPETSEPQITALAHPDPETQTATLILDAATANTVMFAVAAHADEREAHIREVEQLGQRCPEGSFGRRNRQAIAARETRVAARLRAVERAYRTANERDMAFEPPKSTNACRSPGPLAAREIELE
jgi:hypothetical protein